MYNNSTSNDNTEYIAKSKEYNELLAKFNELSINNAKYINLNYDLETKLAQLDITYKKLLDISVQLKEKIDSTSKFMIIYKFRNIMSNTYVDYILKTKLNRNIIMHKFITLMMNSYYDYQLRTRVQQQTIVNKFIDILSKSYFDNQITNKINTYNTFAFRKLITRSYFDYCLTKKL